MIKQHLRALFSPRQFDTLSVWEKVGVAPLSSPSSPALLPKGRRVKDNLVLTSRKPSSPPFSQREKGDKPSDYLA
jgi:hypothetical protein